MTQFGRPFNSDAGSPPGSAFGRGPRLTAGGQARRRQGRPRPLSGLRPPRRAFLVSGLASIALSALGCNVADRLPLPGVPLPEAAAPKRVYLPAGTPAAMAERLRAEGWMALAALDPAADADAEARRLGCTHVCRDGRPVELK